MVLLRCPLLAFPAPGLRDTGQPRRFPAVSQRGPEAPGLSRLGPPCADIRVEEAAAAGGAEVPHRYGAKCGLLWPPGPPAETAGCRVQRPADQPVVHIQRGTKDCLNFCTLASGTDQSKEKNLLKPWQALVFSLLPDLIKLWLVFARLTCLPIANSSSVPGWVFPAPCLLKPFVMLCAAMWFCWLV